MQPSMNPVYAGICECDKQGILQPSVQAEWGLVCKVVQLCPPLNFGEENWCCEDGHHGHRAQALFYLHLDLALKIFGMEEKCFVEEYVVHYSAAY
jgi:hypothetical protein